MKKLFIIILSISPFLQCYAQNIGINATGVTPHPSAMLDVSATDKGMLVPRMTSAQRIAISSPAKGLLVFDNDVSSFWFFNGTVWTELSAGSSTNFWAPNGSDISNINSGKVGIGTAAPISKLSVQTPTGSYGLTHTDGTVTVGSYVNANFGWLGTRSNHPLTFFTNDGGPSVTLATNGNFGVGTTTPDYRLSISSNLVASNTNTNLLKLMGQNPLMVFSNGTTDFGYIKAWTYQPYAPFTNGLVIGTGPGYPISFSTNNYSLSMIIADNGNVGIGTANPTYKLSVNGNIHSKEVVVETGWADYVFNKNYQLKPLQEVEKFIEDNKHLPGIPSAEEIEKNGLQLGNTQKKMMEKIEELTLYVIKLNEQIQNKTNK
jgi:hypothetical protein